MKTSLLGLMLVGSVEVKTFDEVSEPESFEGFTVTVEYNPSSSRIWVVREFYEEIMGKRPELTYFKTANSSLPGYKLPAVIVRCDGKDVYHSYGATPPRFVWKEAVNFFVNVLDRESKKCGL